jgi:DNA-binding CsgD family transcriptional regulator
LADGDFTVAGGQSDQGGNDMNPDRTPEPLTPREASVLALIVQGSTSKDAGVILGISPRTIEFHRANIMQKLSAKNVADLMRIVLQK